MEKMERDGREGPAEAATPRGGDGEHACWLLVDAIADHAIFMLDPAGRIASWSRGAERMTGFVAEDVLGAPSACLYPRDEASADQHAAVLEAAAVRGKIQDDGWRVRKDGSRFWAEVIITPMWNARGGLLGYAEIARDGTERRNLERALADARDRMRALVARSARVAEEEKMSLSREIHDVLGQELTGLKLDLSWLRRRVGQIPDPPRGPLLERLGTMTAQVDGCVQTVRRIATGLRPSILDDLGLDEAIEWQAHEFQVRAGIRVELSLPDDELKLDHERATALFRIFQELITNVARHAGATAIAVQLTPERGGVRLEVSDNGRGISPAEQSTPKALGLLGMRERAAQFGGTLELQGRPGHGTRAVVRIPGAPV